MSKGYGVPNLEDRRWMAADLTDVDADDAESKGLYWYDAQVKKMGSGSKKGKAQVAYVGYDTKPVWIPFSASFICEHNDPRYTWSSLGAGSWSRADSGGGNKAFKSQRLLSLPGAAATRKGKASSSLKSKAALKGGKASQRGSKPSSARASASSASFASSAYGSVAEAMAASKAEAAAEVAAAVEADASISETAREHRGPCGRCKGLVYIDQKRQKSKKTGKYFHGAGAGCRVDETVELGQDALDRTAGLGAEPATASSKKAKRKSGAGQSKASSGAKRSKTDSTKKKK